MLFRRSTVRYSDTPPPETPYQAAGQLWDARIGSARVQAYHWRVMAFGAFALAALTGVGLIWQSARSIVKPYIVQVDGRGAVVAVSRPDETFHPADYQIAYHLREFLIDVRSLPLDPIVLRENWLKAYAYVTPRGAALLNEYARNRDPFAQVGRKTIAIDVVSVIRASNDSFQLRWTERTYQNGSLQSTEYWTALFTIVLEPPKDDERMSKNPLGIYIDGLDWSREIHNDSTGGHS